MLSESMLPSPPTAGFPSPDQPSRLNSSRGRQGEQGHDKHRHTRTCFVLQDKCRSSEVRQIMTRIIRVGTRCRIAIMSNPTKTPGAEKDLSHSPPPFRATSSRMEGRRVEGPRDKQVPDTVYLVSVSARMPTALFAHSTVPTTVT